MVPKQGGSQRIIITKLVSLKCTDMEKYLKYSINKAIERRKNRERKKIHPNL